MPHEGILLVMVPGAGIAADDFAAQGLVGEATRRFPAVTVTAVDPGLDSYLDGSVERRLLAGIDQARQAAGASRVWLAGISLGCQGILRCLRERADLAEGAILLTPYLASTGVIAEIAQAGGLRRWTPTTPEHSLLGWLAATPLDTLPRLLLGLACADRFAAIAAMLAELLPPAQVASVPGGHDWASWRALWRLILDRDPFA